MKNKLEIALLILINIVIYGAILLYVGASLYVMVLDQ